MYYTHLFGEIRKSTILLYRVFDVTFLPFNGANSSTKSTTPHNHRYHKWE